MGKWEHIGEYDNDPVHNAFPRRDTCFCGEGIELLPNGSWEHTSEEARKYGEHQGASPATNNRLGFVPRS